LDFFVLSEDKNFVTVYSLNESGNRYEATEAAAFAENGYEIVGVSVSDFNHDGHLDLLLSQKPKSSDSSQNIHHRLFLGDGDSLKLSGWKIPASKDQFLLFDSQGRMLVDFLGVPANIKGDDTDDKLMIWTAEADDPQGLVSGYTLKPFEDGCKPVSPQSHAFADFNGDGFADLLLICESKKGGNYLKLLISDEKDSSFKNPLTIDLPKGHGPISLGDVDSNGSLDLIFAVCYPPETCSQENSIRVLFNTQRPFCTQNGQENCKVLADIMEADKEFIGFAENNQLIAKVDENFKLDTTIPLAIGDYNVNGFPDILAVVKNSLNYKRHPILLENLQNGNKRTFQRSTTGTEELEKVSSVTGASFINLYQDGPPDVILNYQNSNGNPMVKIIQNGFVQDAFFLRTEALNGVCPATCMSKRTGSTAHRPYGSSFPGPTVKFSFTDFDGSLRIRSASQLPQSGNGRISSPFLLFGLGRTNNFVELLAVRTPSRIGPNIARKAGLVPNSDLIINSPHADSPNSFHFELHILPGQYFLWVLISIATAILVLGSLTAYFKWREIKEDNEERKKAIHSINFDAL
jgi:integrin alpha FG-GAP repeat containing protein 1